MDSSSVQRESLWRGGIKSFETNWREWAFVALIFFFILAAFYGVSFQYMEPIQAKLQELKGDKEAIKDYLLTVLPTLGIYGAVMVAVIYLEHYLFYAFFMEKEFPGSTRKASVGGFFCFLGVNILIVLVVMIPFVAAVIVSAVLAKMSRALTIVGFIASFFLMFFLALRLYPAIPLAAAGIKSSLKTGWAITRGQCWRIFGNTLMIMLIFLGVYVAVIIAAAIFGAIIGVVTAFGGKEHLEEVKNIVGLFVKCVVSGGMGIFMAGIICAFNSAVCRILYQEKRRADPNFILTTCK